MKRQPRRWSKSFCRKKARPPQKAQRPTPSVPTTPSKLAVKAFPHFVQEKSPASVPANTWVVRQSGQ